MKSTILALVAVLLPLASSARATERFESCSNRTVLVFTPHPDDDTFAVARALAIPAKNKNRVVIVIYTNDNKGSCDQEMTSEHLGRIREAEEEASCAVLGIPSESPIWAGYNDGDSEVYS